MNFRTTFKMRSPTFSSYAMLVTWVVLTIGSMDAIAAEASKPNLNSSIWNDRCGEGADIGQGCDRILARQIVDGAKYPWSAIGRVNSAGFSSKKHCTGALIGERLMLTAAHCLYDKRRGKWLDATSVHFLAGYQRGNFEAHSVANQYSVSDVHDIENEKFAPDPSQDWALVELENSIGLQTGYLGWNAITQSELRQNKSKETKIGFAGYPAIRKQVISVDMNCGKVELLNQASLLIHNCAVMSGDSGGPVFIRNKNGLTVIGLHSGAANHEDKLLRLAVPVATFNQIIGRSVQPTSQFSTESIAKSAPGQAPQKKN